MLAAWRVVSDRPWPSSCLRSSPHPRAAPVWHQTRGRAAVLTRSFVFWPPWHMERAGTAQMSAKCWWREWGMDGLGLRGSLLYCPVPGTAAGLLVLLTVHKYSWGGGISLFSEVCVPRNISCYISTFLLLLVYISLFCACVCVYVCVCRLVGAAWRSSRRRRRVWIKAVGSAERAWKE